MFSEGRGAGRGAAVLVRRPSLRFLPRRRYRRGDGVPLRAVEATRRRGDCVPVTSTPPPRRRGARRQNAIDATPLHHTGARTNGPRTATSPSRTRRKRSRSAVCPYKRAQQGPRSSECTPRTCSLGAKCGNRRLQRWKGGGIDVRDCGDARGFGLFACRNFKAGALIGEYVGRSDARAELRAAAAGAEGEALVLHGAGQGGGRRRESSRGA